MKTSFSNMKSAIKTKAETVKHLHKQDTTEIDLLVEKWTFVSEKPANTQLIIAK